MKICVVIPNWNAEDLIAECLMSLRAQSYPHDVIVVDNGSTDESVPVIKRQFPEVTLIELPENTGFAGGVNTGIRSALEKGYDAIALLNNDVVIHKDWLKHLAAALEAHPKAGIVNAKQLHTDKKHFDSTGDLYSIWGMPTPRGRNLEDTGQYDQPEEVFSAPAAATLYRTALFKEIGLFDEKFFAYLEDVDISFRTRLAGWKIIYEPKAEAYHRISATSSKLGDFSRYHFIKNLYMTYVKNMPGWLFWKYLPLFSLLSVMLAISNTLHGGGKAYFRGFGRFLLNLPAALKDRRRIQKARKVSTAYIDSLLSKRRPEKIPPLPTEAPHPDAKHIVIDNRIRRSSTGRYSDRLVEHLQSVDTVNRYTILLSPDDDWQPTALNFTVAYAPYAQFSLNPLEQIGFARLLYRLKADLVHFPLNTQPLLYFKPVITSTLDLTMLRFTRPGKTPLPIFWVKMALFRFLFWYTNKKSRAVITISNFVKKDLEKNYPFTRGKTFNTYCASEPPLPGEPVQPKGIAKPFIMYVGTAFPHKNLDRLVEAFGILAEQYKDLHLVCVGKKEQYYEKLEKFVADQPTAKRITLTGFIPDESLKWLYQNAEAYVFPSLSEGFGLPGLEAMVHGCPVVSSNATCLPEIYGEAAHYFSPTSIEDIAKKVSDVLESNQLRQDLIEKGHRQAAKYSWRKMAEETLQVYKSIL